MVLQTIAFLLLCCAEVMTEASLDIVSSRHCRSAAVPAEVAMASRELLALRDELKPWSDKFRSTYGRTPTTADAARSAVPGLLSKFRRYIALRKQVC